MVIRRFDYIGWPYVVHYSLQQGAHNYCRPIHVASERTRTVLLSVDPVTHQCAMWHWPERVIYASDMFPHLWTGEAWSGIWSNFSTLYDNFTSRTRAKSSLSGFIQQINSMVLSQYTVVLLSLEALAFNVMLLLFLRAVIRASRVALLSCSTICSLLLLLLYTLHK